MDTFQALSLLQLNDKRLWYLMSFHILKRAMGVLIIKTKHCLT